MVLGFELDAAAADLVGATMNANPHRLGGFHQVHSCSARVGEATAELASHGAVATVLKSASEEGRAVTEHTPYIDFENLPAPTERFLVTQFITMRSVARSRAFYSEVLRGQVVLEENPCIIKLSNSWLIMNPGGGPTPDKPDISVVDYERGNTVSTFMNLRVADIQECYEEWSSKGAEFVTPPIDRGAETRCYMRDPDGYLIEVGQSTGLLEGRLASKRPEDLPG